MACDFLVDSSTTGLSHCSVADGRQSSLQQLTFCDERDAKLNNSAKQNAVSLPRDRHNKGFLLALAVPSPPSPVRCRAVCRSLPDYRKANAVSFSRPWVLIFRLPTAHQFCGVLAEQERQRKAGVEPSIVSVWGDVVSKKFVCRQFL